MAKVYKYKDESLEALCARFKRKVNKEGIIGDMKKHREYNKPSELRREQENTAKRNAQKRAKKANAR